MGNTALIVRRPNQFRRIIEKKQSYGSRAHRAPVSGRRWRSSRLFPRDSLDQSSCRCVRCPSTADDSFLREYCGNTTGIIIRAEPLTRHVALNELPGKLGVVCVLTEGKRPTAAISRASYFYCLCNVFLTNAGGITFDWEAQGVSQALTDQATAKPLFFSACLHLPRQ